MTFVELGSVGPRPTMSRVSSFGASNEFGTEPYRLRSFWCVILQCIFSIPIDIKTPKKFYFFIFFLYLLIKVTKIFFNVPSKKLGSISNLNNKSTVYYLCLVLSKYTILRLG